MNKAMLHPSAKMTRIYIFSILLIALLCLFATQALAAWQSPSGAQTAEDSTGTRDPYFTISGADVSAAVAEQLQLQAVVPKADVSLAGSIPGTLYAANHPLKLVVHALQIDPNAKRWQAQAHIMAAGKTETVKPISGTYDALIDVPVLTRQIGKLDVIAADDLRTRTVPERQLRKDSITDAAALIGKSARAVLSADRPIRAGELIQPILVKRGEMVELTYSSPYMHLKTKGIALEDGGKGALIRVKNEKSEKAVSGRVADAGRVEVNDSAAM